MRRWATTAKSGTYSGAVVRARTTSMPPTWKLVECSRRSLRRATCSAFSSRVTISETTLRSAPWLRRKAPASKSWGVVEAKVKEPVSSKIPRAMTVASGGDRVRPRSLRMRVRMAVVEPISSTTSTLPCTSSSVSGWWS